MKIRCTVCGAPNETAPGFDTASCLTCGSQIAVNDALAYRFSRDMLTALDTEVLVQLAAVKSAINNIGREILKEHIRHCVVDAVQQGNEQVLQDLDSALDKFMK